MSHPAADRNLLFGILALQMDFVSRDALIQAMHAWVLEKDKPFGDILRGHGALAEDDHAVLEALVRKHLRKHGDDAEKSLAAVSSVGSLRQELQQLADPDLDATLAHVAAARDDDAAETTHSRSLGTPTSSGLRFLVVRPHARGGLGQVSVALDTELNREVALKEIQERHADQPHSRARFVLEAEVTGGLEHPGIVPVYGLGTYADGRPFYAMRFIKGDSLKDAIARFHGAEGPSRDPGERALALRQLLGRFVDVCNAIAYAHSRGVLHRDLKPGNVMLGKYGETLVVDWGLAKVVGRSDAAEAGEPHLAPASADSAAPTQMGSAVGTPGYMSPEQAAGRLDLLGPASDVYSLGATLYAVLTGQAPFAGPDQGEVQRGAFAPLRRISRSGPTALEAVCLKAMALKAQERYGSALALAADVEHWLADEPVTAYREPLHRRLGRWRRRHPAAATALLVTLLLACAGWLWLEWDHQTRREETGRRLNLALGKAEQLRDQAGKLALDEPGRAEAAVALWRQGLAAVEEAEGVLAAGLADADMRRQVAELRGVLETAAAAAGQALGQLRKDAKFQAAAEQAPLLAALTRGGRLDYRAADDAFARAFKEYGLDVRASTPAAVERWLRQCPARMVEPLLVALNDWEGYAVAGKQQPLLGAVLQRVDADPWRRRLRAALVRREAALLRALAAEANSKRMPAALLSRLGEALYRQKEPALAVELLRRAQSAYPADFRVHYWLGLSLRDLKAGRPAALVEAVGCMRAAVALRPQSSAAHHSLGHALHGKKDLAGAIAAYRKAIELDPNASRAHNDLGVALRDRKDVAGAIAAHRKAIQLDPNFAPAHSNLGVALRDKKDLAGAIAAHRKAIQLDPNYARAHTSLGNALLEKKDVAGAIAAMRKAIELDPDFAVAHNNLGVALRDQKDVAGAIAAFRKAIELDPNLAEVHSHLGVALAESKDLAGALAACRKAIELDPNDAAAHTNLGIVLADTKDLVGALAAFRKAIEVDPNYAEGYYNLGVALRDKGRFTESLAAFRRFQKLAAGQAAGEQLAARAVWQAEALLRKERADQPPLKDRLHVILGGTAEPAGTAERLALAQLCRQQERLYAASARFYAEALAADPKLADDLKVGHRYAAARAAALAGVGQGKDGEKLDEPARARLRQQALEWLKADLALWTKQAEGDTAEGRAAVEKALRQWRREADLAGIRDDGALDGLPEAERAACERLWADVVALLKKTRDPGNSVK